MVWDRGFWTPIGDMSVSEALAGGELEFTICGEKLKGSWVLVRLAHDRTGHGKHNNWLLIKHRDAWSRSAAEQDVLNMETSSASGRTMEQIQDGEGAAPHPFIQATHVAAKSDAIWHSRPAGRAKGRLGLTSGLLGRQSKPQIAPKLATAVAEMPTLSHPDKFLWSGDIAVTKRDLAEYLQAVGPWLVPHITGRPRSLVRAPEGINGPHFFQRHSMAGRQNHVTLITVHGDRKPYLQIDTIAGLVAMAQLSVVEFHPWNTEPSNPDVPGRLVFDLDPAPDVAFSAVVAAAKELRKRLEKLGLIAFCKTTGGKGLHLVTPLAGAAEDGLGWDEAKLFAQAVCQKLAHDQPTRYLTKMTKKLRTGRIFLDYFRNDRMATAVAPLSPRARPGATVSMPLTWSQVRSDLDPGRFTVRTVPKLMGTSRAWLDYDNSGRSLKAAIEALVRQ